MGAFCLSEASSGSDAFAMKCSAKEDGDHWILNGEKLWITNAEHAGVFIVHANCDFSKVGSEERRSECWGGREERRNDEVEERERERERERRYFHSLFYLQKHRGISAFVVDKGTPGLSLGKKEDKVKYDLVFFTFTHSSSLVSGLPLLAL